MYGATQTYEGMYGGVKVYRGHKDVWGCTDVWGCQCIGVYRCIGPYRHVGDVLVQTNVQGANRCLGSIQIYWGVQMGSYNPPQTARHTHTCLPTTHG